MSFQFSPETILIELERRLTPLEEARIPLINKKNAFSTRLGDLNQIISQVTRTTNRKEFSSKFLPKKISLENSAFDQRAEAHELGFELRQVNRNLENNQSSINKLKEQIRLIQLEIGTREEIRQPPILAPTPIVTPTPRQPTPIEIFLQIPPQPTQIQDNTLRNALLVGGALLLLI